MTLHEPVIAPLVLWNVSPAAAETDVGQSSEESYRITVTRPDGELVAAAKPLWAQGPDVLAGVKSAEIAPGQSYTRSVLLNEWFSFDATGRYEVSVAVHGVDGVATFEVEVSPKDDDRLRSLCERLASGERAPRWGGDQVPERVLSFVADEVAIPYLVKMASADGFTSGLGEEGLVRIGDLPAVSALASLPQGRGWLLLLIESTNSEPVKQAITGILAGTTRP